jgi:hypothetical protein
MRLELWYVFYICYFNFFFTKCLFSSRLRGLNKNEGDDTDTTPHQAATCQHVLNTNTDSTDESVTTNVRGPCVRVSGPLGKFFLLFFCWLNFIVIASYILNNLLMFIPYPIQLRWMPMTSVTTRCVPHRRHESTLTTNGHDRQHQHQHKAAMSQQREKGCTR